MLETRDLHWLAGWLEGEGCFEFRCPAPPRKSDGVKAGYPRITAGCTDKDVAERAHRILGTGSMYEENNGRTTPMWRVNIQNQKAIGWMMTLYTLMGKRRQTKIKEIISSWRNQKDGRRAGALLRWENRRKNTK